MIEVPENPFKDTSDLCLPLIRLKELGERDLKRRREHIAARLADEERIRQEKELRRLNELAEKEENAKFLAGNNFIWGKHWDREFAGPKTIKLPPLSKPYLTLFDTSSYRRPENRPPKKRDPLLRFNTAASSVEVESDFHPIFDCGLYRGQLQRQMRIRSELAEADRAAGRKLDELMHQAYPFGRIDYRHKQNQQDRFPRIRAPHELGALDERFFPWCTTFGKTRRPPKSRQTFEPIICKTKTSYAKM